MSVVVPRDLDEDAICHQLERLILRALRVSSSSETTSNEDDEDDPAEPASDEVQRAAYLATALFDECVDLLKGDVNLVTTEAWRKPLRAWLTEYDEDAAERIAENAVAFDLLVDGFFAIFSLPRIISGRFAVGDVVLVPLAVDGEWHEAKIERIDRTKDPIHYGVRILQFGAPLTLPENDLRPDPLHLSDDTDENECVICRRDLPLTFHHLVPRETHDRVLKRGAKRFIGEIEPIYEKRKDVHERKTRKEWLNVHGINVCRKCHSQIHRVESNMSLALKFNTFDALLQHPEILRWRSWASAQRFITS